MDLDILLYAYIFLHFYDKRKTQSWERMAAAPERQRHRRRLKQSRRDNPRNTSCVFWVCLIAVITCIGKRQQLCMLANKLKWICLND